MDRYADVFGRLKPHLQRNIACDLTQALLSPNQLVISLVCPINYMTPEV